MRFDTRKAIILSLGAVAICFAGCGGGGGGGGTPAGPVTPVTPPAVSLGLSAQAPVVTGMNGQDVSIPVVITGTGTVTTAIADIQVNASTFGPVAGVTSSSVEIDGLSDGSAACYKWIDSQTIRVIYASSEGVAGGSVLVNVPVKVLSEGSNVVTVLNSTLNQ